jgi:hypothetical protein
LTNRTALVGHGGWADGRLGNYAGSTVLLNDYVLIEDFAELVPGSPVPGCESRLSLLNRLGEGIGDSILRPFSPASPERRRRSGLLHRNLPTAINLPDLREDLRPGPVPDRPRACSAPYPSTRRASTAISGRFESFRDRPSPPRRPCGRDPSLPLLRNSDPTRREARGHRGVPPGSYPSSPEYGEESDR